MPKTEIPSEQILNDDVRREDLNTTSSGNAVLRKVTVGGIGIEETHDGADVGTGDVNLTLKADGFGMNKAHAIRNDEVTVTGSVFTEYDSLDFTVTDSAVNEFRANVDFIWRHNSASNDARFRFLLDGNVLGEELRIEPKDAGTDQRYQNSLLDYLTDLSIGVHTLSLEYRPATASRQTTIHRSVIEVWRTA